MDEYLKKIVSCIHKLKGAGTEIRDELTAAFMMAGLTEEYRQMIMSIESSDAKFTSEDIKSKLLQEVLGSGKYTGQTAMIARNHRNNYGRMKCFECGNEGHFAKNCKKQKNYIKEEDDLSTFNQPKFKKLRLKKGC